jgi:hypothetical protein
MPGFSSPCYRQNARLTATLEGIQQRLALHRLTSPWGKPPGVPLTKEEFAERKPLWNAWVEERQKR